MTLRAMNGEVELICGRAAAGSRFGLAAGWLRGFEARFSRFDPCSELSRLNAAPGRPFVISPSLLRLVTLSLSLAERSGGLFDPTVLRSLEAAGYDRSFELIGAGQPSDAPRVRDYSWRDVSVDEASRSVWLPPGAGIDLGGVGKGFAADRLAAILGSPCLVNAGGDVCASGAPDDGDAWLAGIEDPFEPERDLAVLAVIDRGIATSSRLRRRWLDGRRWSHHLIDPRSGGPSGSDAVQVTVIAANTVEAEYHAKVALLLGANAGRDYLDSQPDVEGLIVEQGGSLLVTRGFEAYVHYPQAKQEQGEHLEQREHLASGSSSATGSRSSLFPMFPGVR